MTKPLLLSGPVPKPRFSASFSWHDLPPPPVVEYLKSYTPEEVTDLLQQIATDPVLKTYVLDQPDTDHIGFSVTARDKAEWGEHDRRYQLNISCDHGENDIRTAPLNYFNIYGLVTNQVVVHLILNIFQLMKAREGLKPVYVAPTETIETGGKPETSAITKTGKGLSQVAGMSDLKEKLVDEVVGPLHNPDKYAKYGLTIPNGILLYGPPGCGKTYVAEKLAEELGYAFIRVSMGSAGSPYIHQASVNLKKIFEDAVKKAPAVLFLDEIEALLPDRNELGGSKDHKLEEIAQLLTDLAKVASNKVLLLAATNKPWMMDGAALRTGRMDKHIFIGPPDAVARKEMLAFHLKGRFHDEALKLDELVEKSDGFAASDLKFWVDEAARRSVKLDKPIDEEAFNAVHQSITPSVSAADLVQYEQFSPRG